MTDTAISNSSALNRLVRVMLVGAAIGLVAALCTLIFHGSILAHQLGESTSPERREALSSALWSRPGPAMAVAVVYPLFIRRLRRGSRSMYRRVVIVAALQVVYISWLVVAADYPWWLRALYVLQILSAAAVLIVATRRPVRSLFPRTEPPKGNTRAAWFLVVATPLIAELAFGSTPITLAWLLLLWIPLYGGGVLLVRELVVRTGRGWPSILVLALAYEIIEDGLGLQALTSPRLYDAAEWGIRIFGINVTYWEANAIYHALFSFAIPIALANTAFPTHRVRPYLTVRTTVVTAVVAVLGVVLLRFAVPPSQDPGYQAPVPFLVGSTVAVVALTVLALRVLPPVHRQRTARVLPPLRWFVVGSFVSSLSLLVLSFRTFGSEQPVFTRGTVVVLPMLAAAAIAVASALAIRYAHASTSWTSRHSLAVIGGACAAHSVAGAMIFHGTIERVFLVIVAIATVAIAIAADRRINVTETPGSDKQPARNGDLLVCDE